MPLITGKSREDFSHNVGAEMNAGKPQAQSIAIAYAKQREAKRRKKLWHGGYAAGGEIAPNQQDDDLDTVTEPLDSTGEPHTDDLEEEQQPMEFMASGGMVNDDLSPDMNDAATFFHALKRRQRRFG